MGVGADDRLNSVGGTVHLAAALQKAAVPGTVLVSSRTVELCQFALDVVPQPDHALLTSIGAKVLRLEAEPRRPSWRSERSYRSPLVGRQAERSKLHDLIVRRAGERHAAAVIGPPGIGKSRLAAVAIEDALTDGQTILVFHGDQQKRTTPHAATRALLFEALAISDGATDEDILAALRAVGIENPRTEPMATVMLAKGPQMRAGASGPPRPRSRGRCSRRSTLPVASKQA